MIYKSENNKIVSDW